MLDVFEGFSDLSINFGRYLIGLAVPSTCIEVRGSAIRTGKVFIYQIGKGKLTLARTLNYVTNTNGLAIPQVLLASFSVTLVVTIGQVSHRAEL